MSVAIGDNMANEFGIPSAVEEIIRESAQKVNITSGICNHCGCELEPDRIYSYWDGLYPDVISEPGMRQVLTVETDIVCEDCMLNASYNRYMEQHEE